MTWLFHDDALEFALPLIYLVKVSIHFEKCRPHPVSYSVLIQHS